MGYSKMAVPRIKFDDECWDDLRSPANALRASGTRPPGWEKFRDNGAASEGVYAWMFDKNAIKSVGFQVQIPHNYKLGTNLHPHVHWSPIDTDTGSVRWVLEYTLANIGGTFSTTSLVSVNDPADGTAYKHQIADFTPINGSGITNVSTMLICALYREADHVDDDYDNDAALLEFDVHYIIDSIGSEEEYSKYT